jgi:putative flippase GtrA
MAGSVSITSMMAAVLRLVRNHGLRRFVLFLMVGSVNFVFYYSLFTFLHFIGTPPTRAVVIATIVAVLFNFMTTGRVVFKSGNIRKLPRFIGVYAVQMGLNIVSLRALISLGIPVLIAEALVIGVLAVLTFFALRWFVFNDTAYRKVGAAP